MYTGDGTVSQMIRIRNGIALGVFCGLIAGISGVAQSEDKETAKSPPTKKTQPSVKNIESWVKQLTSRDFAVRRAASQNLVGAGVAAIGPVASAADGDDLERTIRCVAILKQLQASKQSDTGMAARKALERLTKSRNTTVARRAESALPKPDPVSAPRTSIRLGGGGGNARRISVRVTNGQRTIEVTEKGRPLESRQIVIQDENGTGIRVAITRKVKGKSETREVKAKSVEELKTKDAEAYKLYKLYAENNGAQIQIRQFGGAVPGKLRGFKPFGAAQPVIPLPRFSPWHRQVEAAREEIANAVMKLQELAKQPQPKPEALQAVVKQLGNAEKALAALLSAGGKTERRPRRRAEPPRKPSKPRPESKPKAKPKLIKT